MRPSLDHSDGTRYVPDKPCLRGHRLRWVSTSQCVICSRDKERERYAAKKPVGPQKPRTGPRKQMPAEALQRPVERVQLTLEGATQHLRLIALQANPGPVQDAYRSVLQDVSDYLHQCRSLPPLLNDHAPRQTLASWNSFDSSDA